MAAKPDLSNLRAEHRKSAEDTVFPGQLFDAASGQELTPRLCDVSARGLGIYLKAPLQQNTRLVLTISGINVTLEVVYCYPHLGLDYVHRVGLFARDPDINLVAIFARYGLVTGSDSGITPISAILGLLRPHSVSICSPYCYYKYRQRVCAALFINLRTGACDSQSEASNWISISKNSQTLTAGSSRLRKILKF